MGPDSCWEQLRPSPAAIDVKAQRLRGMCPLPALQGLTLTFPRCATVLPSKQGVSTLGIVCALSPVLEPKQKSQFLRFRTGLCARRPLSLSGWAVLLEAVPGPGSLLCALSRPQPASAGRLSVSGCGGRESPQAQARAFRLVFQLLPPPAPAFPGSRHAGSLQLNQHFTVVGARGPVASPPLFSFLECSLPFPVFDLVDREASFSSEGSAGWKPFPGPFSPSLSRLLSVILLPRFI
ncbi:unnamed protein product [Rangifer tarandus platyrhynchus]|uniref:Uncharacterized protein n=2 Tax=Rangifer tarandus platyrhynchus TaxID=3082113 RepID=A0ABN8YN36_RANTA|nr:unnamed protein product [Rangifer tarandus platyrhynchus]CAI9701621.1 unnamed protein product [Rangifer tarandus platyrhynchus]